MYMYVFTTSKYISCLDWLLFYGLTISLVFHLQCLTENLILMWAGGINFIKHKIIYH